MAHPLASTFTHWTDAELYEAERICAEVEGFDCFSSVNLNRKMTYLQTAKIRLDKIRAIIDANETVQ